MFVFKDFHMISEKWNFNGIGLESNQVKVSENRAEGRENQCVTI